MLTRRMSRSVCPPVREGLYVLEGVKDIVLFSPAHGELLHIGAPILDIRTEVEWGKNHPPRNRGPPSRGAAKKKKQAAQDDTVTMSMAWLNNFAAVDLDRPPREHAQKLRPIRATVRAGEALFIPQGWYHNVLSVSTCLLPLAAAAAHAIQPYRPRLTHVRSCMMWLLYVHSTYVQTCTRSMQ